MSIRAMVWALDSKINDHHAKLVLIALADHANDDNFQCWPSVSNLADRCEMSRATAYRAIEYLIDHKFLARERRWAESTGSNRSSLFTLHVDPLVSNRDKGGVSNRDELVSQLRDKPCLTAETSKKNLHLEPSLEPAANAAPDGNKESQSTSQPSLAETQKAGLYRLGAEVLGKGSGGLVTKLLASQTGNIDLAMSLLYRARTSYNAREYIGRVISKQKAEERTSAIL